MKDLNLEKAAEDFCGTLEGKEYWSEGPDHYDYGDTLASFKAGAQWQKEQMMKDAVEADIAESFTPVSESPNIYMHGFTCVYEEKESTPYVVAPCKVKLIIIKE